MERGLPRLEGHREGSNSVREVTRTARRIGVQALTLYAFSAQNWSRPADEVAGLMDLLREYLESERQEILENGIRLDAVGELERLPRFVREPLDSVREASARNRGMVLTLALSYGGQEEIAAEEQRIVQQAAAERDRLLEQARRDIDVQVRLAKRELTEHAADLAVELAADRIAKETTPADHARLVDRYLTQVKR